MCTSTTVLHTYPVVGIMVLRRYILNNTKYPFDIYYSSISTYSFKNKFIKKIHFRGTYYSINSNYQ